MKDFSKDFLNKIEAKLLEMKKETMESLKQLEAEVLAASDAKEDGDITQEQVSKTLQMNLAVREKSKLNQIDKALSKIKDGSYGYCVDTEEPISQKRLLANPLALRTVEAQEDYELRK